MSISEEKQLVNLCVRELCRKMGYGENDKISQRDIAHLCHQIEEKTKILISLSTIKRIINGKFDRLPQQSTLDALTRCIGYEGWQHFRAKKTESVSAKKWETNPPEFKISAKRSSSPFPSFLWRGDFFRRTRSGWLYPLIIAGVVLSSWLVFRALQKNEGTDAVTFSAKKIYSEGVPKTVVFNYNIDEIAGDSFFIQPSWNRNHKLPISKNNHTLTEIYYEPGYHTAKLISNDKVIKQVVVHIPTSDWVGYTKVRFTDLYPEYLKKDYLIHDSVLGTTMDGLKASNIDYGEDKIYYYAHFPDSIHVSSDNFKLTARMRMSKVKNTLCPWVIAEAYSENSFFYFTGTLPGCVSQVETRFSDQYLNGKTTDLSSFGFDVMQWNKIEIEVKQKTFIVSVEGKQVFSQPYSRSGGLIKGMGFGSNGLCEVDFVELRDAEGNVVYENDFTK